MPNSFIALTGNIATGKSFVAGILQREYGFSTVSADEIGHHVLRLPEVRDELVSLFGPKILSGDEVDRRTLGQIVFSDFALLKKLNAISHPRIARIAKEETARLHTEGHSVVLEAAVLFEAGWETFFPTILVTVCHPAEQIKRLKERNRFSEEQARAVMSAQMAQEEKIGKATYVIDTTFGPRAFSRNLALIVDDLERNKVARNMNTC